MKISAWGSVAFSLMLAASVAQASQGKNLTGRIGVGATNLGPTEPLPALSVDWEMSQASALEFNFGLDTRATLDSLLFGVRYNRNLYIEDNQFYFVYLGAGLLSQQSGGSGFELETGLAANFFLDGLPNLGFTFGSGLRLESPGSTRFRTVVFAGVHYYF